MMLVIVWGVSVRPAHAASFKDQIFWRQHPAMDRNVSDGIQWLPVEAEISPCELILARTLNSVFEIYEDAIDHFINWLAPNAIAITGYAARNYHSPVVIRVVPPCSDPLSHPRNDRVSATRWHTASVHCRISYKIGCNLVPDVPENAVNTKNSFSIFDSEGGNRSGINLKPWSLGRFGEFILTDHRLGGIASVFNSLTSEHNLPEQKAGSQHGSDDTRSRDKQHPKRPNRHGLLGGEIALFTLCGILGVGAGSYALSKVGKSRSIPVNLGWIALFGIGCTIGGVALLIAIMGSV